MIIDQFESMGVEVIFLYMPAWEMFFSMHVLAAPEHHQERGHWVFEAEREHQELVEEIRNLRHETDNWNLVIDSDEWKNMRFLDIPEMMEHLRQIHIIRWNHMVRYGRGEITVPERDKILSVINRYYQEIYRREEIILFPFLKRMIRAEADKCQNQGIWNWAGGIHERLKIEKDQIVFLKNREYAYPMSKIKTIYATVSTFLSPHLWNYERGGKMELVKSVRVEKKEDAIPADFLRICKALGDEMRLCILREIVHGVGTTKGLANKLHVSEAAISKHLSLLWQAGMVEKHREGNYVKYELVKESIDFIPYRFYEMML